MLMSQTSAMIILLSAYCLGVVTLSLKLHEIQGISLIPRIISVILTMSLTYSTILILPRFVDYGTDILTILGLSIFIYILPTYVTFYGRWCIEKKTDGSIETVNVIDSDIYKVTLLLANLLPTLSIMAFWLNGYTPYGLTFTIMSLNVLVGLLLVGPFVKRLQRLLFLN